MTARYFVDTNVLVYARSTHPDDQRKRIIAQELLRQPGAVFSAQVLQEFYAAAVSKRHLGISPDDALSIIRALSRYPVMPVDQTLVLDAIDLHARHQISYWDAAILAAARVAECGILYSEDLSHGQAYDGVLVQNPFR